MTQQINVCLWQMCQTPGAIQADPSTSLFKKEFFKEFSTYTVFSKHDLLLLFFMCYSTVRSYRTKQATWISHFGNWNKLPDLIFLRASYVFKDHAWACKVLFNNHFVCGLHHFTNQPDITWCNCYSVLVCCQKMCHISAYLSALWPRRPSVLLIHGCLHTFSFRQQVALTSGLFDTAHSGAVLLGRKIT